MACIEFKNEETRKAFLAVMYPQKPRELKAKIAYQRFKNGAPVFTLITRD